MAAKHPLVITDMRPLYGAAAGFTLVALLITFFNLKKKYTAMFLSYLGVTIVLLGGACASRSFIEPWVSCKQISEEFNKLDTGDGAVLSSKFYVRGVRFYTDRKVAVMDIHDKGFWSPHPVPFLNEDHLLVEYIKKRPVTWAILKDGNVKDLERIRHYYPYTYKVLKSIGGKHIVKIERPE